MQERRDLNKSKFNTTESKKLNATPNILSQKHWGSTKIDPNILIQNHHKEK